MRYVQRKKAVVFKFTGPTPTDLSLPSGYGWGQINQQNLNEFFAPPHASRWRLNAYNQLLQEGCIGFVVYDRDGWAAVQWIATPTSIGPPHLAPQVSRRKFWCFNEHTREGHRRIGLWRALKSIGINHVRTSLAEQNMPVYSDTALDNSPSRIAHQNFGFHSYGVLYRVNIRVPKITTLRWARWAREEPHPRLK